MSDLKSLQSRNTSDKQGVEIEIEGKKYLAFIRKITPKECCRLQGIPEWYNWGDTSEGQIYRRCGKGWNVDTIKYIWENLPKFDRPIVVWSLFDGISCAGMTLKELGVDVKTFVSCEFDKNVIKIMERNFPDAIQTGRIEDFNVDELVEKYGVPDFICGGSPCQSFSFAGKRNGMSTEEGEEVYTLERYLELKNEGFEFTGTSYLFWEYMRVLSEVREKYNPNILFFLENVKMSKKWEACLSRAIGVRGFHVNSALVSAQQRKRIYWNNIKTKVLDTVVENVEGFELPQVVCDIPLPEDKGLTILDIIEDSVDSKYYLKDEQVKKMIQNTDKKKLKDYITNY